MAYRRFEDLPVWIAAIDLAIRVYDLAESGRLGRYSGLRDQIGRAALSISNNIAEGFERGTTAELISFLFIARGSAGEVRSMIVLLERMNAEGIDDFADLRERVTNVSRQLGSWIASLQSSKLQGPRTLTDQQKVDQANVRRREDFLNQLHQIRTEVNRPGEQNFNQSGEPPGSIS